MTTKNLVTGLLTGVALLSVTALLMHRRKQSVQEYGEDQYFSDIKSPGWRLANKAKHRAQHLVTTLRNEG